MKAVILYCSFSGNTEYVAKQIQGMLEKAGHPTQCIDALQVIQDMHLMRRTPAKSKDPLPTGTEASYCAMKAAIAEAEILAVGTVVDGANTPPGLAELLGEKWLPDSILTHLKFIFTFSTRGETTHKVQDILPTILMKHKHSGVYAGHVDARGTDNWAVSLLFKPQCYLWSEEEHAAMIKQTEAIIEFMSKPYTSPPKSVPFKTEAVDEKMYVDSLSFIGIPVCDHTKCVKCGYCAQHCPYGAISMRGDVEDGFPVVDPDLCYGCCRCFNRCPKEALNYTRFDSTKLQRSPAPCVGPKGVEEAKKKGMEPVPAPSCQALMDLVAKRTEEWHINP